MIRLLLSFGLLVALAACGRPEPGPAAKPDHQSRAKSQFDRARFEAALDSLTSWHEQHATSWAQARPQGRSRAEIEETFAGTSFVVPEELFLLWGHHDARDRRTPRFDGAHRLLGTDESRAAYDSLRADPRTPWRHNWIPVLEGDGEWIAVEASRRDAPAAPVVVWHDGAEPGIAATNLTLYFAMVVAASDSLRVDRRTGTATVDPQDWAAAHAAVDSVLPFAWGPEDAQGVAPEE